MNEELFDQMKEIIEQVETLRDIVYDIEMKIDNENTQNIKSDFKLLYTICNQFRELEKDIYYKYLI